VLTFDCHYSLQNIVSVQRTMDVWAEQRGLQTLDTTFLSPEQTAQGIVDFVEGLAPVVVTNDA
jgi:hypothetical protein